MMVNSVKWLVILTCLVSCSPTPKKTSVDNSAAANNARLGLAYLEKGQTKLAFEKLSKALSFDPNHSLSHHYMAELYRRMNQFDDAKRHYKKAIRYSDNDPALHNNYGVFLCERKEYKAAIKEFLSAAKNTTYSSPEKAYENAARCARRIPDNQQAEKYLRQALTYNPSAPIILFQLAQVAFDSGSYLKSRAFIQRYHAVSNATPVSLWLGVQVERNIRSGSFDRSYGDKLIKLFPKSPEAKKYRQTK